MAEAAADPALPQAGLRVRVRLFAIQRELAGTREVHLDLPEGSTVGDAWDAVAARHPVLAPGRPSVRFARNGDYAEPATPLEDGDEVAFIPPVSGGAADDPAATVDTRRILEISEAPIARTILADLEDAARDRRGRGGRRVPRPDPGLARHAGAGPGGRGRSSRRPVRRIASGTRPTRRWRCGSSARSRTRSPSGSAWSGSRSSIATGEVALGETSIAIVAVAAHRDAAFRAVRYAIDETKARAPDLEGGAVPRRSRLDRRAGPDGGGRPIVRERPGLTRGRRTIGPRLRHPSAMPDDLGPLDRLLERAETLAGAWTARARGSTTVGRERALLRMFGISGLDTAGRPLAWAVVDRYLAGGRTGSAAASSSRSRWPSPSTTSTRSGSRWTSLRRGGSRDGGVAPARAGPAGDRRGGGRRGSSPRRSSGSTRTGRPAPS